MIRPIEDFCCQNDNCSYRGKKGSGNLSFRGWSGQGKRIRLIHCKECKIYEGRIKIYKAILTFSDNAEIAVNFYVSIFANSKIINITKYGKDERLKEGKILAATFELKGNSFMAMDIGNEYAQDFSWAISLFVSCDDESEFDFLFSNLSENGKVMMGPEPVFNLRKVAWVTDKFGVTWQLVWE